jgi:hypothetical protein
VKPIDQYATLKDFTSDIDQSATHLPFKIMGKRRLPDPQRNFTGTYYTASMLAEVYKDVDDPDLSPGYQSIQAPFGEILKVGCRLWGGPQTYSASITPNKKTGSNFLQADLVSVDASQNGTFFPAHKLAMITSHSCGITNSDSVSLIPVYLESELNDSNLTALRGKKSANLHQIRGNLLSNEIVNFFGLPGAHIKGINEAGERMLACLHLQVLANKKQVPSSPVVRLTYRALTYFQFRLALLYLRDVQDSDDTRDF